MRQGAATARAAPQAAAAPTSTPSRRRKLPAYLVTSDPELWPLVGAQLPHKLSFRQIDSIAELSAATPAGQPALVVWDARGCSEKQRSLSDLHSHSACFAVVVLDDDAAAWEAALRHAQIVALVPPPPDEQRLIGALGSAYEEVNARIALIGDQSPGAAEPPRRPRRPLAIAGLLLAVLAAALTAVLLERRVEAPAPPGVPAVGESAPGPALAAPPAPGRAAAGAEETVDELIERAQAAMRDRHFIDPAAGSALSLYRSALALDPGSGEARQGLQRLAEVLVAKVQTALDEKKFDAALQALETVRSIDPQDQRLPALDERIAKMRAKAEAARPAAAPLPAPAFRPRASGAAERAAAGPPQAPAPRAAVAPPPAVAAPTASVPPAASAPPAAAAAPAEPHGPDLARARLAEGKASGPNGEPLRLAPAPSTGPREVSEASLTRTRSLEIDYPQSALARGTEGRVEVGYIVTAKGSVADLKVLTSTPAGVFDRAAANAVARLRYKPVLDNGKAIPVSTKMLVIFRLAK